MHYVFAKDGRSDEQEGLVDGEDDADLNVIETARSRLAREEGSDEREVAGDGEEVDGQETEDDDLVARQLGILSAQLDRDRSERGETARMDLLLGKQTVANDGRIELRLIGVICPAAIGHLELAMVSWSS